MNKVTLYLPVEIKGRELKSHIILSKFASKLGMRTYIGSKPAIYRLVKKKKSKGGTFIYKAGLKTSELLKLKKKVEKFVILDQEMSPSCFDFKKGFKDRIYPGSEKYIEKYYVIGQLAYEAGIEVIKQFSQNIVKSGWPRIDMCRSEFAYIHKNKIKELKDKYGKFILFNSAFCFNSKKKIDDIFEYTKNHDWETPWDRLEGDYNYTLSVLEEFKANIEIFKKLDDIKNFPQIIIRPHPSEDHEEWFKISKSFKNIKVIYDGDVEPWVYACSALLHRGCATSVQAYMAGIPVGYPILKPDLVKRALPYDLSEHLFNLEEIIKFCQNNINQKPIPRDKFNEAFTKYIHIEKKYASEIILEDISKFNLASEPPYEIDIKDRFFHISDNLFKYFKKKFQNNLKIEEKIGVAPQSQKMPGGIDKNEIQKTLTKFFKNEDLLVKKVFNDCIMIESK